MSRRSFTPSSLLRREGNETARWPRGAGFDAIAAGRGGHHAACQLRRGGCQDRRAGAWRLRQGGFALFEWRRRRVPHGESREEERRAGFEKRQRARSLSEAGPNRGCGGGELPARYDAAPGPELRNAARVERAAYLRVDHGLWARRAVGGDGGARH